MLIAYLSEIPQYHFPYGNRDAKKTLEKKLPSTSVEVFEELTGAVGKNWDGPLFSKQYDLIVSGIMMLDMDFPELEKCHYGRTAGIHVLRKVRDSKQNINYNTPWLIISMVTDPNYLNEIKELHKPGDALLNLFKSSKSEVIETIEGILNREECECLKKRV